MPQPPSPLHSLPEIVSPTHVAGSGPQGVVGGANGRHFPTPSHLPSAPQLPGKPGSGAQTKFGSVPAKTGEQIPSLTPVSELRQEKHVSQSRSQQMPSSHDSLRHSVSSLQAAPAPPRATHWPL